jgi:hypothetical protein
VREFSGTEPLVGEIVGVRAFRVDDSGLLLPLQSEDCWYDGVNAAVCAPPTGDRRRHSDPVPADHCECGFYAYGSVTAAGRCRGARYVQAVISCWGGVVAGTQGVRAQYARIDAIWLHPAAPTWLRRLVAARYPSVRIYADVDAMFAEHPLTELPCYQRRARRRPLPAVATVLGLAATLAIGVLPAHTLHAHQLLWVAWVAALAGAGAVTTWLAVGARGIGHVAAAVLMGGVLLWLVAPLLGLAGWLLRVPLLRCALVPIGGYLVSLRPRYFPIVKTERERTFRGLRA